MVLFKLGDTLNVKFYVDLGLKTENSFNFTFKVVGIYDFYPNEILEHLVNSENESSNLEKHNHEHNHEHENETIDESILRVNEQIQNYRFNILYASNETVLNFLREYSKYSSNNSIIPYYQATFELFDRSLENNFKNFANQYLAQPYTLKSSLDEYKEHIKPIKIFYNITLLFWILVITMLLAFNFIYIRICFRQIPEIKLLYDIGYSKFDIFNLIKYKYYYSATFLILITSVLGYLLSTKKLVAELLFKILNNLAFVIEPTGTNSELLFTYPTNYNFTITNNINLSYQFIITVLVFFMIFTYSTKIILMRNIHKGGKKNGKFNNKKFISSR